MKLLNITFLGLCIIGFNSIQAQDDGKVGPTTFTAGWSTATFAGDDDADLAYKSGFFAGVRKEVKIIPMLYFNTGLLYTQQGTAVDDGVDDIKLDYLDIPIGLKFKLGPVFATGGVTVNLKISQDFGDIPFAKEPDIKSFDIGYSLGLGTKFLAFSLDLRWNNSFGDIAEDTNTDGSFGNSYFLVGLGFSPHKN
jgi:hypothetical protein